jgi:glycosyltransferase involved in cell wall biosynthesis
MLVHIDLSEILRAPLRTGIQRVEREAIRHWPGPSDLIPCRVDTQGRFHRLSTKVLEILCADDDDDPGSRRAEWAALQSLSDAGEPVSDRSIERVLNLEFFSDPVRADGYLRLSRAGVRILWYIYDFLVYLRPELFRPGVTKHFMHYLRALRGTENRLAFLSPATRDDYVLRILRRSETSCQWPVVDPGADGLGLERQLFSPERQDFVAIGTVESRKNHDALLRAFELLWNAGSRARLIVAGQISPDATNALEFFARHSENPYLKVLEQPSDETLRGVLRGARAVVMPSESEGFGLPPYEAVHAGMAAIASSSLPSAALMTAGALLLDKMDANSIAGAVKLLSDDTEAARLWSAARTVTLPRWTDFGRRLGDWAQAA